MHDLLMATVFAGMVIAPAFAAFSGFRDRTNIID
jgi:hypothetical protein